MITTITPNPSVDVSLAVPTLHVGEVHRATSVRHDPAGKGINVSRALAANGVETTALFPADDYTGAHLVSLLSSSRIHLHTSPITESIRQNVTITDDYSTTKINEIGPTILPSEVRAFTDLIADHLRSHPRFLVAAGSLPPGLDTNWLIDVAQAAAEHSIPFAADVSGEALAAVVESGCADLIKPNREELAELLGHALVTTGDVVRGVRRLMHRPTQQALVSLGGHGALLVTSSDHWWAGSDPVTVASTVGAGDCTLAGYLSSPDSTPDTRLRNAVAWGTAAVTLPGTQIPTPHHIAAQSIHLRERPALSTVIEEFQP